MLKRIMEQPWTLSLSLVVALSVMMVPELAAAQQVIGDVLCGVVRWFTGPVGKGIATLAIIIIGIGALMGKVSWGMAIIVGVGVAVIFGAEQIVDELDTAGSGSCSTAAS